MKKKLILLAAAFIALITFSAKAQVKSYIGISGGISTPIGDFAQSDYGTIYHENNKAGYAKTGATFALDGAFYIHQTNWAIAGIISYQDQGQLSAKDVQNLSSGYTDGFGVDQSAVTSTKRYQNLNILVGPQYSFIFSKLTLDLRAVAGVIKSFSTPEIDIVLTDDDKNYPFTQHSSTASAFAYGGSAGLRYSLGKCLGIALRENYVASSGITITNDNRNNNAGRLVTSQPISEFQTTLGLTFQLH
jgi:hypothetical protein